MDMEPAAAAAVLQVGLYYGAARLIGLCEVVLSRTLTDAGVSLQGLAPHWRACCLHICETRQLFNKTTSPAVAKPAVLMSDGGRR